MPTGSKRKAPSAPRDPADDCETPDVAYAHIAPLLRKLAQRLGKPPGALRIWDPYYCAGGVKARLDALGFGDVVNDPVQQTIVAGIVAVAGKMDVRVVAEFVADEYMQETLRNLGVSFVQGYHVGRPRPWADVIGT